jgi:hypothetical protein
MRRIDTGEHAAGMRRIDTGEHAASMRRIDTGEHAAGMRRITNVYTVLFGRFQEKNTRSQSADEVITLK